MIERCPKCENESLSNATHGTSRCHRCGGMFVPRWRVAELLADEEAARDEAPPAPATADEKGGQCPADRTIMARTRIELGAGHPAIHLERCSSCHGTWFDAGEWAALASRHLLDRIDELWTAEWRAKQRRQHDRDEHEARVKALFGDELYGMLVDVAQRLKDHPRRSQALAIIRELSD